jgi:hypothetical protein
MGSVRQSDFDMLKENGTIAANINVEQKCADNQNLQEYKTMAIEISRSQKLSK